MNQSIVSFYKSDISSAAILLGTLTGLIVGLEKISILSRHEYKNGISISPIVHLGILNSYSFAGFLTGVFYPITFPAISAYSMYKLNSIQE
jgi:hypothetical protein